MPIAELMNPKVDRATRRRLWDICLKEARTEAGRRYLCQKLSPPLVFRVLCEAHHMSIVRLAEITGTDRDVLLAMQSSTIRIARFEAFAIAEALKVEFRCLKAYTVKPKRK